MTQQIKYSKGTVKTLAGFYKDYLKKNPKGSPKYLTSSQYRDLLELYFQLGMYQLITTGNPFNLGVMKDIYIVKLRPVYSDQKQIDWKRTKATGEKILHANNHSNGYYSRIKWNKYKTSIKYKYCFKFSACRWAKRLMKTQIIEHNTIIKYYG